MSKYIQSFENSINWLHGKLTAKQFLLLSSILVAASAAIIAVMLKTIVYYIHFFITKEYSYQNTFYFIFPSIGIILCVLFVQKYLKGKLEKGTKTILYSIAKKSSFLPRNLMYSNVVTSAITVGFGGSAGLESPIVTTGSAIGSNYAKTYHLNYKDRTLLLACGAAAGIAAGFNSPIAGVLFALEVLLADVTISAFIPLIIAAATGGLISKIILQEDILFSFHLQQDFDYHNVPYYIVLGILAGLVSLYYARTYMKIESALEKKKTNVYVKALLGGLMLCALILFLPPLFGEGFESIKVLSDSSPEKLFEHSIFSNFLQNKWIIILLIVLTMFIKVIAAAFTVGSGGNGGNFAPSLFVGAYLGFAFASCINLLGIANVPISNFTIVAMAGVLSGVFYAPLTGIFLIAEITGGYELMIPLMIVAAISFMIAKYFEPFSMDSKKLAAQGHIFIDDKDKTILSSLKMVAVIETNFQSVSPDATLGELIEVVAQSKRNIFPVVENEMLVGIVLLDDIREIMFKHELYDKIQVRELLQNPPETINADEDVQSVMKKFDETNAWNLPVLNDGKYVGFVSKSSLLIKYRDKLMKL
ncbi:MAG: chloride channel protein [Bacteroidetes bacterium]|nr:chloride channel protein [Bacteroidota bacterium]